MGGRKVGRMADQNGSGGKRISLSGATRKFSNANLELCCYCVKVHSSADDDDNNDDNDDDDDRVVWLPMWQPAQGIGQKHQPRHRETVDCVYV